ncbi:MAG: thioesterase family protein, partial [Acidimicrobiia bacterium]|nr:thioesterase family protein [Acidimicrobiia bacterium]
MVDAMFERDGMRVRPGPLCTGPWDPNSMHGGPPTVLAGRYLAEHGGGDAFHLARL